jgi:hypothetical protein
METLSREISRPFGKMPKNKVIPVEVRNIQQKVSRISLNTCNPNR